VQTARHGVGKWFGCRPRDCGLACLRSCVAEEMSWKAPLSDGIRCKAAILWFGKGAHMGKKIWSETWMDLRGYELNVVPSSTAKRFSPMPTSSDSCGEPIFLPCPQYRREIRSSEPSL